jgi:subtilisin
MWGHGNRCLIFAVLALGTAYASAQPAQERYIVVLESNGASSADVAADIAERSQGRIGYVYEHALEGFSISVAPAAAQRIARDPRVQSIERDLPVSITAQSIPTGIDRSFASGNANLDIDGTDDYRVDVDVAVVDTGIDLEHPDLNVAGSTNCLNTMGGGPPWSRQYFCDGSGDDDHYHGTHVAGTIGALDNGFGVVGVAPGARLWAVKVLDSGGSGYTSGIVAGIDWVVGHGDIEVLNMSLGGSGVSTAFETAIDNAVANGVVVVVAAGNSDADANGFSPAYVPSAITVSALADFDGAAGWSGSPTCRTDQDDTLADFSNWGSAVDIAAPGVCILSTYPLEKGEYATISGTSMAAPHVAGAAALLASGMNTPLNAADVQNIRDALVNTGNFNWTDDSGDGMQEPLLDVSTFYATLVAGSGESGGGPVNVPPTAAFSYACGDARDCSFDGSGSGPGDGLTLAYEWDFGDGSTGSGISTAHSYAADGTYTVTLTVIEDNDPGDSATDIQLVTVYAAGGAGATLSSSSDNNGSTWTAHVWRDDAAVSLTGSWSYSGGTPSCLANVCSLSGIAKRESSVVFWSDSGEEVTVLKP